MAADADVRVITTGVNVPAAAPKEPFDLVPLRARVLLERPVPLELRTLLREVKSADALHIHTPFPGIEFLSALLGRILNKRIVVTYHMDAISAHAEEGAAGKWLERVYDGASLRPALRLCDQIATNSLLYIDYSRVLPSFRAKTVAVHQGIRQDRAQPLDGRPRRARLLADIGAMGDPTIFLFVGRLVDYKGLQVAIPAMARALSEGVNAHLVIGGKGPMRETLEALVKEHGLADRVHFIGFVPDGDLVPLFAAADVVICPSVSALESTPISLLEAMAQGTAVIGSEVGGTAETIVPGEYNRIVKPDDVEGLAAAMVELARVAHGAPKRPRYPRTWKIVAEEYLALLTGRGPGRT